MKRYYIRIVFSPWWCRLTGRHVTVPRIPFCFRCLRTWPTWEDVKRG